MNHVVNKAAKTIFGKTLYLGPMSEFSLSRVKSASIYVITWIY